MCLLPRCWIIFPGILKQYTQLVCSTIKKVHDLSLNRCKTGWILSFLFFFILVRKELIELIISNTFLSSLKYKFITLKYVFSIFNIYCFCLILISNCQHQAFR